MLKTKTILILIISAIVVSCASPAERFAKGVTWEMIETARNDLIGTSARIQSVFAMHPGKSS